MGLGLGLATRLLKGFTLLKAAGEAEEEVISPSDISNLVLWLKADTGCTDALLEACDEDTDNVLKWADQSGQGNDFDAANPGVAPFFGTDRLNSLPSVIFGGVDQTMGCSSVLNAEDTTFTVFIVAYIAVEQDDDGGVYALLGSDAGAYGNIHLMWAHDERDGYENSCFFGAQATSGKRIEEADWMADHYGHFRIYTFRMKGPEIADQIARWNGGDEVSNATGDCTGICDPAYDHRLAFEGGTDSYAKIELAEVIIYSDALSDKEMGQVEAYLADRFDITLAS